MGCCGDACWEFVTIFSMHKVVRIHSPHLRVPEVALMFTLIVCFLFYSYCIKLQFLKMEDVDAKIIFQIKNPTTKIFQNCTQINADCIESIRPFSGYPYCDPSALPKKPRVVGCNHYDHYDITQLQYSQTAFIGTLISDIYERRCSDEGGKTCERTWTIANETRHFVAGIEDFVAGFVHSFGTRDSAPVYSSGNTQAFISWLHKDGARELKKLPCFGTHCGYNVSAWNTEPCGIFSQDRSACYSDEFGDFISIDMLLKSANLSLDDPCEGNTGIDGVTNRVTGIPLMLEVEYLNYEFWDFWRGVRNGGDGLVPKYIYTLKRVPLGSMTHPLGYNKVSYPVLSSLKLSRRRHLLDGLLITVNSTGRLGQYSMKALLISLSIITTLYAIAHLSVKFLLVFVYEQLEGYTHIAKLKHWYNYEEGATESEMNELAEKLVKGDKAESPKALQVLKTRAKDRVIDALFHPSVGDHSEGRHAESSSSASEPDP